MLQWFCGHTKRDRVRNEVIRERVGVAPIEEKLTQHRLRWFGQIQRRPPEAPVRSWVLKRVDKVKRGRGRPKLTCDESIKRDLKDWNISEEIALDRDWLSACLNRDLCVFWVSSLAYSNLLGTKDYVVVVAAAARNMGSWHWYCQTQIQIKVSVTIQVIFRNKCASIPRASSSEKGKRY